MKNSDRILRPNRRRRAQATAWTAMQKAGLADGLPAACVVDPDQGKRKTVLTAMGDYLLVQGAQIIVAAQAPGDTPDWAGALPERQAAATALDRTGTTENPLVLLIPRLDLPTPEIEEYLRTARSRGHCYAIGGIDPVSAPDPASYGPFHPDTYAVGLDGDWNILEGAVQHG